MARITWLDTCRGLAILFLIAIHYIGALESRGFITVDILNLFRAFFRVATPFFIFTFGFTFYIAYKKKIIHNSLLSIYNKSLFQKLLYILVARELIAVILSFKSSAFLAKLPEVLTFQSFSFAGEILIFYFFALFVAPVNIRFLLKYKLPTYIFVWSFIYILSFYIGSTYITKDSYGVLRFLFYDVYPFFPFLLVMAFGMLMAHIYQQLNNKKRACFFLSISIAMLTIGLIGFYNLNPNVLIHLAEAKYKAPPNIFYIFFYVGLTMFVILVLASLTEFKLIPKVINTVLSNIGRYSLIAYVLHYTFYLASYIPKWLGKGLVWEVMLMISFMLLSYGYICWWDNYKKSNELKGK